MDIDAVAIGPEPESESILCLSCAAPNDEGVNFCQDCGAPITPYASTGPFESIWAEGAVCRAAVGSPTKLIVVAGAWMIFIGFIFQGLMMLGMLGGEATPKPGWEGVLIAPLGVGMLLIGGFAIYATTRNYLRYRHAMIGRPDRQ